MKSWSCVSVLVGHTDDVRCLKARHGSLISCSDDKSIRVWNMQILLAPIDFIKTCYSTALIKTHGYPTDLDAHGRTALMLVSRYG
jgi:WD40 repeat protein